MPTNENLPASVVQALEARTDATPLRADAILFIDEEGDALSVKIVGKGWPSMRAALLDRALEWLRQVMNDEHWIAGYDEEVGLLGSQLKDAMEIEDDKKAFTQLKEWIERWTEVFDIQTCPGWVTGVPSAQWTPCFADGLLLWQHWEPERWEAESIPNRAWCDQARCWYFPIPDSDAEGLIKHPGGRNVTLRRIGPSDNPYYALLGVDTQIGYVFLDIYAFNHQSDQLDQVHQVHCQSTEQANALFGHSWEEMSNDEIINHIMNLRNTREVLS